MYKSLHVFKGLFKRLVVILNCYFPAPLHGSEQHIWSLSEALGDGSSATVCKGRNKRSGKLLAVKVFKTSPYLGLTLWKREMEKLCLLNHENVVKFLSIEEDKDSFCRVLIMELCQTNVSAMLNEPMYAKGFPEKEFLLLLSHTCAGLKYLVDSGIIHKDIKPSNIMRLFSADNTSIYKLSDFAVASSLDEQLDNSKVSTNGDYMHPRVFAQYKLHQEDETAVDVKVDMWSLACVFYRVATGSVPFRPLASNQNIIFYEMITKKPRNAISAYQEPGGAKIVYTESLPQECLLSSSLQRLLEPLIAGIMETDSNSGWEFSQLCQYVKKIDNMETLTVFDTTSSVNRIIYVDPSHNLHQVKGEIKKDTSIPEVAQILLDANGVPLTEIVDATQRIMTYPRMIKMMQLFLYSFRNSDRKHLAKMEIYELPNFQTLYNYNQDYPMAIECSAICQYVNNVVERLVSAQVLIYQAVSVLRDHVDRGARLLKEKLQNVIIEQNLLGNQTEDFAAYNEAINRIGNSWLKEDPNYLTDYLLFIDTIDKGMDSSKLDKRSSLIDKLIRAVSDIEDKILPRDFTNEPLPCKDVNRCSERLKCYQDVVTKIMTRFRRDKSAEYHSYNDEQIHKMERIKLKHRSHDVHSHYTTHCYPRTAELHNNVQDNFSKYCKNLQSLEHIERLLIEIRHYIDNRLQHLSTDSDHVGLDTTGLREPIRILQSISAKVKEIDIVNSQLDMNNVLLERALSI